MQIRTIRGVTCIGQTLRFVGLYDVRIVTISTVDLPGGVCKYYIGTIGPIGLKYYIGPSAAFLWAMGKKRMCGCADLRMLEPVKCGYLLRILNADVWVKSGCADVTRLSH